MSDKYDSRWLALKLLENDPELRAGVSSSSRPDFAEIRKEPDTDP